MKQYHIYIRSNEHPRTINTPMMGRCWYTLIIAHGKDELKTKITELRTEGKNILEVRTQFGTRIM